MTAAARAPKTETMTGRERILSTLRQEEVDRYPVWLKMANPTWKSSQPEPYRSMGEVELLSACGCDLLAHGGGVGVRTERPHVTQTVEEADGKRTETWTTPDGPLVRVESYDPYTNSWHPTEYAVTTPEELKRLRWIFTDTVHTVDPQEAQNAKDAQARLVSKDAVTVTGQGPSPLMNLVEHWCGPEAAFFLHFDEPEMFAEVVEVMFRDQLANLKARLPHTYCDTFWMTENTSTSLISPDLFAEFCMPHLTAYGKCILEHGVIPVHHMCGTLNALLEQIDTLPALVNEAYTTRPLGDVSLAEGRARMPSKALIGGTNATLWLSEPAVILQTVADDLAACDNTRGIFLTSAGVLPAPVSFEKAQTVVAGLKRL